MLLLVLRLGELFEFKMTFKYTTIEVLWLTDDKLIVDEIKNWNASTIEFKITIPVKDEFGLQNNTKKIL